MHLAQSEAFRFREAEQTLAEAKAIDPSRLADLFAESGRDEAPGVIDASLETASVWRAAIGGGEAGAVVGLGRGIHPAGLAAAVALLACLAALVWARLEPAARRCIRCGRPFCHLCKSGRDGHEYCSQCYHLYVLGDGLAPETKHRKLYDVERHEWRVRAARRLASALLPGSAQLLRGRAVTGLVLLLAWVAAVAAFEPAVLGPFEHVSGLDLRLGLAGPGTVPALYRVNALTVLGGAAALAVWLAANGLPRRRREP